MKGIVFTELLELGEQKIGSDTVEDIIEDPRGDSTGNRKLKP